MTREAAARAARISLPAAWALLGLLAPGCGSSFAPDAPKSRDAAPLSSVYDALLSVPGISLPLQGAVGLTIDLTIAIEPEAIDTGGSFEARVTIVEVRAGGAIVPFEAEDPLIALGLISGNEFALDSFGPIDVGEPSLGFTSVYLSISGNLSPDGRTIDGMVVVTSSAETGTFHAVRQRRYLVAGTDFGVTGTVSLVRVRYDTKVLVDQDLEAISGDPVATASGGGVFIVNRFFFDNVQILDPAAEYTTALQFSTGNGSNPHDALAVDPNRLFVTRYEPPYNDVLIADRGNGAFLGFADLSGYATNASGTPRADSLVRVQDRAIVSLQNIDGSFREYGPGMLVALDIATGSPRAHLRLEGRNPFGPPAVHSGNGRLYYAMAGIFQGSLPQDLSGGIEVVDPDVLATRGLLVDDDDLGGNVSSVALVEAGGEVHGFCVVTLASAINVVRAFDPQTGAIAPGAILESTAFIPAVVSDGDGYLLIPVHDVGNPRLVVLDVQSGRTVATPRLSLPPFSVAVLTRNVGGE